MDTIDANYNQEALNRIKLVSKKTQYLALVDKSGVQKSLFIVHKVADQEVISRQVQILTTDWSHALTNYHRSTQWQTTDTQALSNKGGQLTEVQMEAVWCLAGPQSQAVDSVVVVARDWVVVGHSKQDLFHGSNEEHQVSSCTYSLQF